jgi:perosamine synthetase
LTSDSELARKAKHLTTTAKDSHKWRYSHDQIGYNYRLPNLNAALGCAQLENIEKKIQRKRRLYELYEKAFTPISGIKVFQENLDCRSNYWLQTLLLDPQKSNMRDQILHE